MSDCQTYGNNSNLESFPDLSAELNPLFEPIGKQLNNDLEEGSLVATKVVLKNEEGEPICQVKVSESSEFLPDFIATAPMDFQSKVRLNLEECDGDNYSKVVAIASSSEYEPKVAVLPGFVLVGLAACSIGGISGAILQTADTLLVEGIAPESSMNGAVYATPASMMASRRLGAASMAKKITAVTGAGLVSVVCAELSGMGTKFGLEFLLE